MLDFAPAFPETPVSYKTPGLYTPHEVLSEAGKASFQRLGTINYLMPLFFHGDFMYLYVALPTDDLYLIYPGLKIGDDYYANTRAFYMGAVESKGKVYITEPYRDFFTGAWLISVS